MYFKVFQDTLLDVWLFSFFNQSKICKDCTIEITKISNN